MCRLRTWCLDAIRMHSQPFQELLHDLTFCTVVQLAPGYVYMSECNSAQPKLTPSNSAQSSDDRSGEAMCEENIETAKSEFRLGMESLFCTALIYTWMRKGKCNLGVLAWARVTRKLLLV